MDNVALVDAYGSTPLHALCVEAQDPNDSETLVKLASYLISKEPPRDFNVAYPQGLYLSKVTYPYLDIPMRTDFSTILQNTNSEWREV
jgi:hypothetical protein